MAGVIIVFPFFIRRLFDDKLVAVGHSEVRIAILVRLDGDHLNFVDQLSFASIQHNEQEWQFSHVALYMLIDNVELILPLVPPSLRGKQ